LQPDNVHGAMLAQYCHLIRKSLGVAAHDRSADAAFEPKIIAIP
jgi:hypothetical protein